MFPNVPSPGERFWVPKFDQLTHPLDPVTNQSLGILILNRAVEQWNIIESISQKANWMLKKILIDLDLISFPDASMCFFDAWSILGRSKGLENKKTVSSSLHNLINKLGSERKDWQEVPLEVIYSWSGGLFYSFPVPGPNLLQSNVRYGYPYSNVPPRLSQSIQPQQEKLY